jgi:hypothetical protein
LRLGRLFRPPSLLGREIPLRSVELVDLEPAIARVRSALGEAAFAAIWAAGQAAPLDQIIAEAMEEVPGT